MRLPCGTNVYPCVWTSAFLTSPLSPPAETLPVASLPDPPVLQAEAKIRGCGLRHVAVIMDGNRRWAEEHELPRLAGHAYGVSSLKHLVRYLSDNGLEALTVYAFSTENWKRSPDEVNTLLALLIEAITSELQEMHEQGVRITFLGDQDAFPQELQDTLHRAAQTTQQNTGLRLQIATNYGSRAELVRAVQRSVRQAIQEGETLETFATSWLTEDRLQAHLDTAGLPDPDLLIRTGGESRLSNYMLWQCAYTEFWVTPVLWPDFTPDVFDQALEHYATRDRRYGK